MSENTKIEWTDATWNPVRGCSLVSAGCKNCYAMGVAARFSGPGLPYEGLTVKTTQGAKWNGKIMLVPDMLDKPLHWKNPRKIFVNSMSDLFHEDVPTEYIDRVFAVMAMAKQHTFQVLTKRPERMRSYMKRLAKSAKLLNDAACKIGYTFEFNGKYMISWPIRNIHLGVSVEDQPTADQRIPILLDTPAAVRFLSMEPLLGPVDLSVIDIDGHSEIYPLNGTIGCEDGDGNPSPNLASIDWVIVGGESGPGARPMHPDWARSLRDQCVAAGVPFLFKQWGEWSHDDAGETPHSDTVGILPSGDCAYCSNGYVVPFDEQQRLQAVGNVRLDGRTLMDRVGKKRAGRLLDGAEHNGYPWAESDLVETATSAQAINDDGSGK